MESIFLVVLVFILAPLCSGLFIVSVLNIVHEETQGTTYDMLPGQRVIDYFLSLVMLAGSIFLIACLVKIIIDLFF